MELQVFSNAEFGSVRSIMVNNEPYFVGKDVAEILGYSNTRDALVRHVDEEDKNTVVNPDGNRGNPILPSSTNPVFTVSSFPVRCRMQKSSSAG